jgi:myo-inositol 2-dehydrogenase/D-chiro-inositol 1-dehydrogenase
MSGTNRRKFLTRAAVATAGFMIVPRRVLGGAGFTPPSDELTKAIIGVGAQGRAHIRYEGTRLLAACDVDRGHLKEVLAMVGKDVKGYTDYREVLQRPDIDIVHIATPPHWHALISVDAARAGKDIWCEKPMTRTIGEGIRVIEEVNRRGRMFRINTWFRFQSNFYGMNTDVRPLKKIVKSGVLGWPITATIGATTGFDWKFYWSGRTDLKPEPVPEELDYEMWLGPAPHKPYNKLRVHQNFRGYWDYDGGGLGDMGQHYMDPVQYLLEKDDTGPVRVDIDCPQQDDDAAGSWRRIEFTYADGCKIVLDGEGRDTDAPFLAGPYGRIYRGLRSDVPNLQALIATLPDPEPQITTFSDSVRSRRKFALNESNGHRSTTLVNLGVTAARLGRSLHFDPVAQEFRDDEAANRLIEQPMRAPWVL